MIFTVLFSFNKNLFPVSTGNHLQNFPIPFWSLPSLPNHILHLCPTRCLSNTTYLHLITKVTYILQQHPITNMQFITFVRYSCVRCNFYEASANKLHTYTKFYSQY